MKTVFELIEDNGLTLHGDIEHFAELVRGAERERTREPLEYWNAVEGWVKIDEVHEHFNSVGCGTIYKTSGEDRVPLYTTPPQRPWVGLTDDEINEIYEQAETLVHDSWVGKVGLMFPITLCKMFEDKLKEKNHE